MYDIPALVEACVAELVDTLQPNNACQFYEIGQQQNCFAEVKNLAWKVRNTVYTFILYYCDLNTVKKKKQIRKVGSFLRGAVCLAKV
jgi:hypothetical protein